MKPVSGSALTHSDVERDRQDGLVLLAALALAMGPHASHLPLWVSLVVGALLAWRVRGMLRREPAAPRGVLLVLTLLATAAVALQYRTLAGSDAGVALLVLLTALKLLEMRARRDVFVLIFLGFFVLLTQFIHSQALWVAGLALLSLWGLLTALISLQHAGQAPGWWQRARHALGLLAWATPLVAVLFVFFPRLASPLWGQMDPRRASTGLSETMAPGDISQLSQSRALAFRVEFEGQAPAPDQRYWRALVLGNFDGRNWSPRLGNTNASEAGPANARAPGYRVLLEPQGTPWLPVLEHAAGLPSTDTGTPLRWLSDGTVQAHEPIRQRLAYSVSASQARLPEQLTEPLALEPWLSLPPGFNPRTLQLAADLQREVILQSGISPGIEWRIALAALQRFREQPYRYTLTPPALGRHTADEFLFDTKAGFCEHYASAFVILMRAADVPARVVTGYQGGVINPVDGVMTVTQADAHAWAEVYVRGEGWRRADPTAWVAPDRIEGGATLTPRAGITLPGGARIFEDARWLMQLRFRFEALNTAWNLWVLQWNAERQIELLGLLGLAERGLTAAAWMLGGLLIALLMLSALWMLRADRQRDPVRRAWERVSTWAPGELARQANEGPAEYRARLQRDAPTQLLAHLEPVLQAYIELRYTQTRDVAAARRRFLSLARRLRLRPPPR
jgi:transglutaminase-like putative cysteine protease